MHDASLPLASRAMRPLACAAVGLLLALPCARAAESGAAPDVPDVPDAIPVLVVTPGLRAEDAFAVPASVTALDVDLAGRGGPGVGLSETGNATTSGSPARTMRRTNSFRFAASARVPASGFAACGSWSTAFPPPCRTDRGRCPTSIWPRRRGWRCCAGRFRRSTAMPLAGWCRFSAPAARRSPNGACAWAVAATAWSAHMRPRAGAPT